MDARTSGRERTHAEKMVVLFIEDERQDYRHAADYLAEMGYATALLTQPYATSVNDGRDVLPAEIAGFVESKLSDGFINAVRPANPDAAREIAAALRPLKGVVVDIMFRAAAGDDEAGASAVRAFARLRQATGATFRIIVWSRHVGKGDLATMLPMVQKWGADSVVSKRFAGNEELNGAATGAQIIACLRPAP